MSTQLLIYEKAAPLSREKHSDWSVEVSSDFSCAKNLHSLPLVAAEFFVAAKEYPIGFALAGDQLQPLGLLGMRKDENLFVDEKGEWLGRYVPAFLRRYPFVFASSADGKTLTLCIDESYEGVNQEGKGARLYTDEGEPSAYVGKVLSFLEDFQRENSRTQIFCQQLRDLDLLESHEAVWTAASGEKATLTGLFFVNRKRLAALTGEQLSGLINSGAMDLIYSHLASLNNFKEIQNKMNAVAAPGTSEPEKKKKKKKKKKSKKDA